MSLWETWVDGFASQLELTLKDPVCDSETRCARLSSKRSNWSRLNNGMDPAGQKKVVEHSYKMIAAWSESHQRSRTAPVGHKIMLDHMLYCTVLNDTNANAAANVNTDHHLPVPTSIPRPLPLSVSLSLSLFLSLSIYIYIYICDLEDLSLSLYIYIYIYIYI